MSALDEIILYKDSSQRIQHIDREIWNNPSRSQYKSVKTLKQAGWREVKDGESLEFRGMHHTFELKAKSKKPVTESSNEGKLKKKRSKKAEEGQGE